MDHMNYHAKVHVMTWVAWLTMPLLLLAALLIIFGSFGIGPTSFDAFDPLHAQGCRLFFGWLFLMVFIVLVPARYPPEFATGYWKIRGTTCAVILVIFAIDLHNWIMSLTGA